MRDLMEVVCVIKEPLRVYVGDAAFNQLEEIFNTGTLDFYPTKALDGEIRAHAKASQPGWEWQKLSFVLEKKGEVQDEEISKAQKRINSALQSTLQAGFALFATNLQKTNLQNDQLQHRRYLQTSSPDDSTDTTGIMEARLQPWLSEVLTGFNNGCRRPESEMIIAFCNLTTQGVLSVERLHFLLQQVTALAHAFPKNFVAVIVMPNRAGDLKANANGCKPFGGIWYFYFILSNQK
eukprot:s3355_g2.t1